MTYENNRAAILNNDTAVAQLADVFSILEEDSWGQRKSAKRVGGLERLLSLIRQGKIRAEKLTNKQNGKWFCNSADVMRYAVVNRQKQSEKVKPIN